MRSLEEAAEKGEEKIMNWLLGLDKVWGVLDGWKTYIAGAASILTGLAGLLNEILPLIQGHSAMAALDFVKHLPNDQSWLLILAGLGAVGLRHSNDKLAGQIAAK